MSASSVDCSICLDPAAALNPSACPSCSVVCCRPCIETHLLASDTTDPACPGCRAAWTQTFLYSILKPAFRTGPYQKLREKILFDREKARLPEAQEDARRYKAAVARSTALVPELAAARQAIKEAPATLAFKKAEAKFRRTGEYNRLTKELTRLLKEWQTANAATQLPASLQAQRNALLAGRSLNTVPPDQLAKMAQIETDWFGSEERALAVGHRDAVQAKEVVVQQTRAALLQAWTLVAEPPMRAALAPLEATLQELWRERDRASYITHTWGAPPSGVAAVKKRSFTMKCVQSDCEGFLSAEYKCGLCDVQVCEDCHVPKGLGHVCDASTVATIRQIRKEAHPCPTCAALISKIDGCDQMYCTQCHTAFSWNTGLKENGVIHNPHYFQYMRETGQAVPRRHNPGFACDAVHNIGNTLLSLRLHYARIGIDDKAAGAFTDTVMESYRQALHMRESDLRQYRMLQARYLEQEWRRQLRVKRLLNVIDDNGWKTTLQREEKNYYKITAWVHLLEMYTTVSLETLARIKEDSPVDDLRRIYAEYQTAKAYTVDQAKAIAKVYGCVLPGGLREGARPPLGFFG
jgi:hypothetical protein